MTNAEIAEKIRDAIFARSHDEGGAISKEQMADAIEGVLNKMAISHEIASSVVYRINASRDATRLYCDELAQLSNLTPWVPDDALCESSKAVTAALNRIVMASTID